MDPNPDREPDVELGQANFDKEVLRSEQPAIVAFLAPWSRPCHVLDGVLEEAASACAGRAKVFKVNADDNPELSLWYDIQSVPTLLFFVGGSLRARLVGTTSKDAIIAKLRVVSRDSEVRSFPDARDE
jgi:thioredoxin 1